MAVAVVEIVVIIVVVAVMAANKVDVVRVVGVVIQNRSLIVCTGQAIKVRVKTSGRQRDIIWGQRVVVRVEAVGK